MVEELAADLLAYWPMPCLADFTDAFVRLVNRSAVRLNTLSHRSIR
jgi:hypothetical protein